MLTADLCHLNVLFGCKFSTVRHLVEVTASEHQCVDVIILVNIIGVETNSVALYAVFPLRAACYLETSQQPNRATCNFDIKIFGNLSPLFRRKLVKRPELNSTVV